MSVLNLARPELLNRRGYQAAISRFDMIRLHANEMPDPVANLDDSPATPAKRLNRYPPARPLALIERIAELIDTSPPNVLVTRGSNEGIDLLVRAFCRSGQDAVVACTPTFGMYQICAEVQNADYHEVELDQDFDLDVNALTDSIPDSTKLVFVCSPGNPTGRSVNTDRLIQLCERLAERALVVVDQAYAEFCSDTGLPELIERYPNLVLLRTFSKAWGLAGLRCGTVIATAPIISLLDSILAPYATPAPTIKSALYALSAPQVDATRQRIAQIREARTNLARDLACRSDVIKVYPSDANFLLVKFADASQVYERLLESGILVRRFDNLERLKGCLRITIGSREENLQVMQVIQDLPL